MNLLETSVMGTEPIISRYFINRAGTEEHTMEYGMFVPDLLVRWSVSVCMLTSASYTILSREHYWSG